MSRPTYRVVDNVTQLSKVPRRFDRRLLVILVFLYEAVHLGLIFKIGAFYNSPDITINMDYYMQLIYRRAIDFLEEEIERLAEDSVITKFFNQTI